MHTDQVKKYRVLIVDDSRIARKMMERCVEETEGFVLAASVANALNAELLCIKNPIDLILMDICTADHESGLEAAGRIKKQYPRIKILMVTSMPESSFLEQAYEIGCDGFWYKEESSIELSEMMKRVMEGERLFPESTPILSIGNALSSELTPRELSIIRTLAEGKTYEEIAEELGISSNTVKYHIKNLLSKTGLRNSMQLAVEAVAKKLVLPDY